MKKLLAPTLRELFVKRREDDMATVRYLVRHVDAVALYEAKKA